jgi:uncharacterized protein (DUF1697 family)
VADVRLVALLRGVNVGKSRRVEMKRLRSLCEGFGCADVSTYLNSGNVIFDSGRDPAAVGHDIEAAFKSELGIDVRVLVKTGPELRRIARAIPADWQNDAAYRSDVAYLFPEVDSRTILAELPVKQEYVDVRYMRGAIFWFVDRRDYNRSRLNRLIGHQYYQLMTVRNVNTARALAGPGLEPR